MKRVYAFAISILVLVSLTTVGQANNSLDNWQIGIPNGEIFPSNGATEFPVNGDWSDVFFYTIGTDLDPINSPTFPGYIGPENVCAFASNLPCTYTAQSINIDFELACDYSSGGLKLIYDRYGSEADNLFLDGILIETISATEVGFRQFSFDLKAESGQHTIGLEYAGGGTGNGHFIDYIKLETNCKKVRIDIKPGSDPSCFNNNGRGIIPVAIFGSENLDVYTIKVETIRLEDLVVATKGKTDKYLTSFEDINGDGFVDLVVKFQDIVDSFSVGTSSANLTAELLDGTQIFGIGDICLSPYTFR